MSDFSLQHVDDIDAVLPQTQCTKCGFDGCRPYAEAIAAGSAAINRCPPGGQAGVAKLARLTAQAEIPLDLSRGAPGPLTVAVIDEQHCIGCTLCIKACPVDAIVGANKYMHTVLPDSCTGCDLCVAPCPVDCISMQVVTPRRDWGAADAHAARLRYTLRRQRLADLAASAVPKPSISQDMASTALPTSAAAQQKSAAIAAALARARARRAHE